MEECVIEGNPLLSGITKEPVKLQLIAKNGGEEWEARFFGVLLFKAEGTLNGKPGSDV